VLFCRVMKRAIFGVIAFWLVAIHAPVVHAQDRERDLVGTWMLVSVQQHLESGSPAPLQGARGLLVMDRTGAGTGHVFEIVTRSSTDPLPGMSEALSQFYSRSGSWGTYRADMQGGTITYNPRGGVSPNVMGTEFSRSFELAGDRLTITSRPGELHAQGVTRWTWERVPTVLNFSDEYAQVVGFWQHVVEGRVNVATGEVISETIRAPSVIVYTPSGYVGVHFPTRDRPRFASVEPTEAEARAVAGHLGYYGALGVYPGMVFHQILGGSLGAGSTLQRFFELKGDELHIRFPPGGGRGGVQAATFVRLRRLSGASEMLGR
jgi:hypothetical protein